MRQPGFYWVKEFGEKDWMIGYFNAYTNSGTSMYGGHWAIFPNYSGDPNQVFYDHNLEIDERRIERTEDAILPNEDYDPTYDNPYKPDEL